MMEPDLVQRVLSSLIPDAPDWYGWAKYDENGDRIPNSQRMCWEHAIVIQDGVTKPTKEEFDAKAAELLYNDKVNGIREQRNNLLTETDWVVVKHNELGTPIPQKWLQYRQALRDITEQSGFPDNVEWPTAPSNHEETN